MTDTLAAPLTRAAMHLKSLTCPFCGRDDTRLWGKENGLVAVKCQGCGFVYVNPRPTDSDISEANVLGQHRTETGSLDVQFRRSAAKVRHYKRLIRTLMGDELKAGTLTSWLDVGAGYGELVEAVRDLLPPSSVVAGIEPMTSKARHAQDRGLPVQHGLLSDAPRTFQVVSLINVLSHLPDVDGFLDEVASKIEDGGILLLETGNGGDLASSDDYPDLLFLPDHLLFAGEEHVAGFLARAGFERPLIRRMRRDTLPWVIKNCVKRLLGRRVKLVLPYRSPFRTIFFKARRPGAAPRVGRA